MKIKCKMVGCSNRESRGMVEVGNIRSLEIGLVFIFGDIRSSKIESILFNENQIDITTMNTEYTFLIVE